MRHRSFSKSSDFSTTSSSVSSPDPEPKSPCSVFKNSLSSTLLTLCFFPAYASYSCVKTCAKLPFMPVMWLCKKLYPDMIDDLTHTRKEIKMKVMQTADKSFVTLSGILAK